MDKKRLSLDALNGEQTDPSVEKIKFKPHKETEETARSVLLAQKAFRRSIALHRIRLIFCLRLDSFGTAITEASDKVYKLKTVLLEGIKGMF